MIENLKKQKVTTNTNATSFIKELEDITKKINIQESITNTKANELRDRRDTIEKELSTLGEFKSFNDNQEYTFEFKEKGGMNEGIDKSIETLTTLKNSFNTTFDKFENQANEFFDNTMNEPNTLIEWSYDNKDMINTFFNGINATKETMQSQKEYSSMIMENLEKLNEKNEVSLDKEMVNLLRYQRAYEAAAKVIQTSDEILKTTLSLKS